MRLKIGTQLGNEFAIESMLGEGGFGITYRARAMRHADATSNSEFVAVKEFFPSQLASRDDDGIHVRPRVGEVESFEKMRSDFSERGRVLARFSNPNIVRTIRVLEAWGTTYPVMEYVEGVTLSEHVQARVERVNGWFEAREFDMLARGLLEALDQVHEAGWLHRLVTPENVLMRWSGEPVLIDFDSLQPLSRADLEIEFSPWFSPPEQQAGHGVGPWSDIYSLATTLYFVATGGQTPSKTNTSLLQYVEQSNSAASRTVSPDIARAIDWALHKSPRERPQSVRAWREQLFPRIQQAVGGLDGAPIFISHSSKDRPRVEALVQALEASGAKCWVSFRDITHSEDWDAAISAALSASSCVLLYVTESSNKSEEVLKEMRLALRRKKKILVALGSHGVEPEGALAYHFSGLQWIRAYESAERFTSMLLEEFRRNQ
jgi:serine/threonine protein kinase